MMPPGNEVHEAPSNGASATAYEKLQRGHTSQVLKNNAANCDEKFTIESKARNEIAPSENFPFQPWWLNYDQALDLQTPAQQVIF